jgi:flagellar basal body P-ring protein FlgI
VTWTTVGGKKYVLQAATNVVGVATNNFFGISPLIAMPGTGESATNFTEVGVPTNRPRFYRVQQVP